MATRASRRKWAREAAVSQADCELCLSGQSMSISDLKGYPWNRLLTADRSGCGRALVISKFWGMDSGGVLHGWTFSVEKPEVVRSSALPFAAPSFAIHQ